MLITSTSKLTIKYFFINSVQQSQRYYYFSFLALFFLQMLYIVIRTMAELVRYRDIGNACVWYGIIND
jgi:hypothetical protein